MQSGVFVYILWHTVWDTWRSSSGRSRLRSGADIFSSVLLTKVTKSICFGSDERLLRTSFLVKNPFSNVVLRQDSAQLFIILRGKVLQVVPFAAPLRTALSLILIAQNVQNLSGRQWTPVRLGVGDSGLRFGHLHLGFRRRCDFFPSARPCAHVRPRVPLLWKPTDLFLTFRPQRLKLKSNPGRLWVFSLRLRFYWNLIPLKILPLWPADTRLKPSPLVHSSERAVKTLLTSIKRRNCASLT